MSLRRTLVASLRLVSLLLAACGSPTPAPADGGQPDVASPDLISPDLAVVAASTTVTTDKGVVNGQLAGNTRVFLGIPYAAPPVGDLRWKPPAPAAAWSTPRDATARTAECPQLDLLGGQYVAASSEDCLTVNVWAPSLVATPRPVMVWIHGGGFILGSGGDASYDGARLSAAGNVVVVTLNYRLGPLGFLGHAALTAEDSQRATSGNYGLLDQRAALRWVKTNIAAFGGDPANVTLFGESAGAISVCMHEVSTPSQGLYQRALMESSVCGLPIPTRAQADAQGADLAKALGCNDPTPATLRACLRGKSASEVTLALPNKAGFILGAGVTWSPIVDGIDLPDQPAALWAGGKFAKVPLLLGTNGDEGTIFLALGTTQVSSDSDYQAAVNALVPTIAGKVLAKYPSSSFATPKAALAAVIGDFLFVCPTRRIARATSAANLPTFLYTFRHAVNFPFLPGPLGAFHGSETGFVFGNGFGGVTLTSDEMPLSQAMMGYWSRFADKGDPNGGAAPAWPPFSTASDAHLVLDLTISTGTGLQKDKCDFWDAPM